jgi:hypothetical protein
VQSELQRVVEVTALDSDVGGRLVPRVARVLRQARQEVRVGDLELELGVFVIGGDGGGGQQRSGAEGEAEEHGATTATKARAKAVEEHRGGFLPCGFWISVSRGRDGRIVAVEGWRSAEARAEETENSLKMRSQKSEVRSQQSELRIQLTSVF